MVAVIYPERCFVFTPTYCGILEAEGTNKHGHAKCTPECAFPPEEDEPEPILQPQWVSIACQCRHWAVSLAPEIHSPVFLLSIFLSILCDTVVFLTCHWPLIGSIRNNYLNMRYYNYSCRGEKAWTSREKERSK